MLITFIRHGSTRENSENILIDKNLDPPLSHQGRQEVINLAAQINQIPIFQQVDAIFRSPTLRTRETMSTLVDNTPKMNTIPFKCAIADLHEMDMGDLSGKKYDYFKLIKIQLFENSNSHDGETGYQFKQRAISSFLKLVDIGLGKSWKHIIIIGHNGWMVAVLKSYLGMVSRFKYKFSNAEAVTISMETGDLTRKSQPEIVFSYTPEQGLLVSPMASSDNKEFLVEG